MRLPILVPPGRIAHDYQEGKAPLFRLSFSLWSSKTNFLWQTVYFANELKWFIGCWKIASWNLFLNVLLYKLSSHIWCFPGKYSETEGSASLCRMKLGRCGKQLPGDHCGGRRGSMNFGPRTRAGRHPEDHPSKNQCGQNQGNSRGKRRGPLSPSSLHPLHSQFKSKLGLSLLCVL